MEVKQRGTAFGHRVILFIYTLLGYKFVAFILNFVALYYVLFTPSVKKSLQSYYKHQGVKLSYINYFRHIKMFSLSIFDRFVSRLNPEELKFNIINREVITKLEDGGIVLFSHVGSWASAAHSLKDELQTMNIVMRENAKETISKVENEQKRDNEQNVKIIDLNQGAIASNIQIANALMSRELEALMSDRVNDTRQSAVVSFFGSDVLINKTPFEIANRLGKPLVAIFVMRSGVKEYELSLHSIEAQTLEEASQKYADILEDIMKKYPHQWYNFYDFFKEVQV